LCRGDRKKSQGEELKRGGKWLIASIHQGMACDERLRVIAPLSNEGEKRKGTGKVLVVEQDRGNSEYRKKKA